MDAQRTRLSFYWTVAKEWGQYHRLDNLPRCKLSYFPGKKESFETLGIVQFAPYIFDERATLEEQLFVENTLKNPAVLAILGAVGAWYDGTPVLRLSVHKREQYDAQAAADLDESDSTIVYTANAAHNRKVFLHKLLEEILPYGDLEPGTVPHRYFCKMFLYPNHTQLTNYNDIALLCFQHSGLQYMKRYFSVPLPLVPLDEWFKLPKLEAHCRVTSDTGMVWVSFCDLKYIVPHAQRPLSWQELQLLYYAELANPTSDGAWHPAWA